MNGTIFSILFYIFLFNISGIFMTVKQYKLIQSPDIIYIDTNNSTSSNTNNEVESSP